MSKVVAEGPWRTSYLPTITQTFTRDEISDEHAGQQNSDTYRSLKTTCTILTTLGRKLSCWYKECGVASRRAIPRAQKPLQCRFQANGIHAKACEPLVQPSKGGDDPSTQAVPHPFTITPKLTQHFGRSFTARHDLTNKLAVIPCCGHITWLSTRSSLRKTFFYPLVKHTHLCRSIVSYTSRNVTVWQTCFPGTKHSSLFELTHVLLLRSSTLK